MAGGYDYKFMQDLSDDLICVLCNFALKDPLQIEDCGHRFCEECYQQMKEYAEKNSLELCCPLDRQKITNSHVFKDKATGRTILNLPVKCPNFDDDNCSWIGELRNVMVHEINCQESSAKGVESFDVEFKRLINRLVKLEMKVKNNEEQLIEKDKLIETQSKRIKNLEENLYNYETKMTIPNVESTFNFSPVCTAFQWKINPVQIRSVPSTNFYSPPFYNVHNSNCFQIRVHFKDSKFYFSLIRYRGKYDRPTNSISTTQNFTLKMNFFGNKGKQTVYEIRNKSYTIPHGEMRSAMGFGHTIKSDDIDRFTVQSYVHLHWYFVDTLLDCDCF